MKKLAIIGGSSPFTTSLICELERVAAELPPLHLALHGRNNRNLVVVAEFARIKLGRFGWETTFSNSLEEILSGAEIVIHQARYGGMKLRQDCEVFCAENDVLADETLGPAALISCLKLRNQLENTNDALVSYCPDAVILNLTNPLSIVTALMSRRLELVFGLCELPVHTLNLVADTFEVESNEIEFDYIGLNHRGFFSRIEHNGTDLLDAIGAQPPSFQIGGIDAATVKQLGALPTKYFGLFQNQTSRAKPRAQKLTALAEEIIQQIEMNPYETPPALGDRDTSWYEEAVVPVITTLCGDTPREHCVNVLSSEGIVVELFGEVDGQRVAARKRSAAPQSMVRDWCDCFEKHETRFLAAILEPSYENILETVAADPTIERRKSRTLADKIYRMVEGDLIAAEPEFGCDRS